MDDATKARLNLLWTELSRLVERADADDGSDDDDDDDDDPWCCRCCNLSPQECVILMGKC